MVFGLKVKLYCDIVEFLIVLVGQVEIKVTLFLHLDLLLIFLDKVLELGIESEVEPVGILEIILTEEVKQAANQQVSLIDGYLEIVVTVNIGVNDIHSEGIGFVLIEIFLIKYDVTVLFVLRDIHNVSVATIKG